ncbi:Nucleolar protein 8 [Larimichthys crocea]|uniref:Uncharacterized protein n=1 Tax=Larimichthys crocea TaxID=215358 RepID=A0ACD3RJV4_LARCR|nr:Nucleolar protein 8 [Larimichthys crocea]
MQRLYVGGLSHTVTQKDLKDRFGKFGEVKDVELRTRRDDEGVPYKTFSYININISDADLKKCMTVLNKSKWKGGTLQIETAKESFLHRLTAERQEAAEQRLQQPAAEDKRQKMLNSLSKAGVENFTMKAAVPGTEIPGHKDWVVSKFGRVLPVLQLRCQKGSRARTLKYDPSKYSHNIRKLDRSTTEDEPTPISQLTWELEGGDDDISKKRRGEFPPFEPSRPKKSRTDVLNSHNTMGKSRSKQTVESVDQTEAGQFTNGYEQPASHRLTQRRGAVFDNDIDSDEEIRRMVAAQSTSHAALRQEVDDDNLEVVGLDYLVKSGRSRPQQKGPDDEEENDYDSADTDELLASRKPPPLPPQERLTLSTAEQPSRNGTDKKRKTKKKSKTGEEEDDSADDEDHLTSRKPSSTQHTEDSSKQSKSKKMAAPPVLKPPVQESSSDSDDGDDEDEEEDEEEEEESVDSSSDSDYEAMFSNVTRLEISLADLQRLAEVSQQTTDPSTPGASSEQDTPRRPAKKGTTPEEILASLMDEDSSEDEPKKKKKKKRKAAVSAPLPAFRGMGALNEGSEGEEEEDEQGSKVKKQKLESEAPQLNQRAKHMETEKKTSESSEDEEEEEEEEEEDRVATKVLKVVPTKAAVNTKKAETSSSSSSGDEEEEEEEEEEESSKVTHTVLTAKVAASSSSSSSAEEDEDELISDRVAVKAAPPPAPDSESSTSSSQEEKEKQAPPRAPLGAKEEEERQRKANMRRLAAVQQRQKEAEEHKKLIQGALAKLDAPTAGAGKHIVFGSDDDDDEDDQDKQQTTSEVTASKKALFEDSQSEDETTVKDNDTVKEKLMELQSRFGRDERFRMDSRFLEEDEDKDEESEKKRSVTEEDESLEDERKKNLSILQSVLGSSQQTCSSKAAAKGKTFRDVSALHYDPSREEHAAFETKTDKTKESKSARRKKREEAQKLPEVSKEIYYDVSGDLKAVFGRTKEDNAEEEQKANWDQDEEEEEETKDEQPTLLSSLLSADPSAEKEESSGFKFSFFGDDTETENKETEEYKVESIQAPKVSWQQDPRFHDSSSEEDEEEQEENEEQSNAVAMTTQGSQVLLSFLSPGGAEGAVGGEEERAQTGVPQETQGCQEEAEVLPEELRIMGCLRVSVWTDSAS